MGSAAGGARAGTKPASSVSVKPPVVIVAVALLIVLLGGMAYMFLLPHSAPVHARPLTQSESWLSQKARESGGDFSKLSQADQQHLFSIAGPSAPVTLRGAYQAQRQ